MPSDGEGALCAKDGGETGASCAMSKWRMSCSVRVLGHALAKPEVEVVYLKVVALALAVVSQ